MIEEFEQRWQLRQDLLRENLANEVDYYITSRNLIFKIVELVLSDELNDKSPDPYRIKETVLSGEYSDEVGSEYGGDLLYLFISWSGAHLWGVRVPYGFCSKSDEILRALQANGEEKIDRLMDWCYKTIQNIKVLDI